MNTRFYGLLLTASLLMAAPSYAQFGTPDVNIQGEGPLTRAKKAMQDADQMNQESRKGQTGSQGSGAKKSPTKVSGPVGSSGVNSGKKPIMAPLDKEALAAAKSGLLDTYKQKVLEGANPMVRDESGSTALHLAAYKGHAPVVQYLVDTKGVLLEARDDAGFTPLQLAAASGRDEAVAILVKAGADPNLKTPDGVSPLLRAAQRGFYPVISALLKGGADANVKDRQNQTAAMIVDKQRRGNWEEALRELHEAEKNGPTKP